jgi:hypothetical protein
MFNNNNNNNDNNKNSQKKKMNKQENWHIFLLFTSALKIHLLIVRRKRLVPHANDIEKKIFHFQVKRAHFC